MGLWFGGSGICLRGLFKLCSLRWQGFYFVRMMFLYWRFPLSPKVAGVDMVDWRKVAEFVDIEGL